MNNTEIPPSDRPLVSIGLPIYNGEKYLRRAIDSLILQNHTNFELIISDNASTDASFEICKEYAAKDGRIKLYQQEKNVGAVENFKTVVHKAQGDYFMWVADDDVWLPEFISTLLADMETHPNTAVTMCATRRVCEDGKELDVIRFNGKLSPNGLKPPQVLGLLTSPYKFNLFIYGLFRTEILRKGINVFADVLGCDRIFLCQFAMAHRFRFVDQILYIRTHRQGHEDSYRKVSGEFRTFFKQVAYFSKTLLLSKVVPIKYKLYLPRYIASYFIMVGKSTLNNRLRHDQSKRTKRSSTVLSFKVALGGIMLFVVIAGIFGAISGAYLLAMSALVVTFGIIAGLLIARKIIHATNMVLKATRGYAKEIRFISDVVFNPLKEKELLPKGQPGESYDRAVKAINFVRQIEASRIRELYLQEIFPEIEKISIPIGAVNELSGHPNKVDMLYVCAIAKHMNARNIFEIGTYRGRTTYHLTFSSEDAHVTTLNLPPEADSSYGKYLGSYFKGTERESAITWIFSDSRNFDTSSHKHQYDFIFVDGDHSYDLVKNDTEKAFEMLKPGGVIMWHDYSPKSPGLLKFFREFTQERPLFRIKRSCLLLYVDGVDPIAFEALPMMPSLELDWYRSNPYSLEELYHV